VIKMSLLGYSYVTLFSQNYNVIFFKYHSFLLTKYPAILQFTLGLCYSLANIRTRYFTLINMGQNMSKNILIEKIEVLTEKEAAKYISMSRSFLSQDRMNGYREKRTHAPKFMKLGRAVRYHRNDLDEWLEKNLVNRI
jgi:predicted DNA-binding transcriptional regulator AlpA